MPDCCHIGASLGVYKLIDGINTSKSSGPDGIPGKLLQSLAKELAPVLRFIFEQSLLTGDLPIDWTRANVAPVFKKRQQVTGGKLPSCIPYLYHMQTFRTHYLQACFRPPRATQDSNRFTAWL